METNLAGGGDYINVIMFSFPGGCLLLSSVILLVVNIVGHRFQLGEDWDSSSKDSDTSVKPLSQPTQPSQDAPTEQAEGSDNT